MIMLLKNALKELESNARREEEQLTKKYPLPKTILELLFQYVLHPEFEDPLSLLTIQFEGWTRIRSKTSMFEALWNIIIGLGYLPGFPIEHIQLLDWRGVNKERAPQVIHVQGNSSKTENIINVFKHMSFGTSASGVSDITFLYHEKPENKGKSRIEGCSSLKYSGSRRAPAITVISPYVFHDDKLVVTCSTSLPQPRPLRGIS